MVEIAEMMSSTSLLASAVVVGSLFVGARSLVSEKPGLRHVLDGLAPVGLVLEHRPGGGRF